MTTNAHTTCPTCSEPIPPEAPDGLCPKCLLRGALDQTSPSESSIAEVNEQFPDLEVLDLVGIGGIGRVYKARDPRIDRIVALKVLSPERVENPEWVERFTREAKALARLNHPHIVQVHSFGTNPQPHLVMEFIDGLNLRQVVETGELSAREALVIVPKLCDALHYAHEHGVLHRDIKPENILIDTEGRVKLVDFGLAKLHDEESLLFTLTQSGAKLGTIAYMAPEQIENPSEVDHRADIYSLGVVFYELLTGELPLGRFPSPSEANGTDPRLDSVVMRTLEKKKEKRYPDAETMGSEITSAGKNKTPAKEGKASRPQNWWKLAAIILAMFLAILAYSLFPTKEPDITVTPVKDEQASKEGRLLEEKVRRRDATTALIQKWTDEASRTSDPEAKEKAIMEMLEAILSDDSDRIYAALGAIGRLVSIKMDRNVFQDPIRELIANDKLDWQIRGTAISALFTTKYEPSDVETVLSMVETIPEDQLGSISSALSDVCGGDFTGDYAVPMLRLLERGIEAEKMRKRFSASSWSSRTLLGTLWGARVTPEIESLIIEWSYLDTSERGIITTNSRGYYAFYSALSVFSNKRTPSVKRLLELAENPDVTNIAGRCFWGMKNTVPDKEDQKLVASSVLQILKERNHEYMWRQGLGLLKNCATAEHIPAMQKLADLDDMPEDNTKALKLIINSLSP